MTFAAPIRPRAPASLLSGSDFLLDPYPAYATLREAGPVLWSDELFDGAWVVTRHADVESVLRDPRLSARRTGGWAGAGPQHRGARSGLRGFQRLFARAMLFLDAPDHARVRATMQAAFRPAALNALAPRIERIVAACLAAVDPSAPFDFMQAVARRVPSQVVATLLGVDPREEDRFAAWSDDLAAFIGALQPTHEHAQRAQRSLVDMATHFEELLATKRREPADDLASRLLQAACDGKLQDSAELLAQCAMLLFAGFETTRNLLGNGLHALLRLRPSWEVLAHEPSLLPGAVRELLRYDSPVQYTGRRVTTTLELHGQRLERGDLLVALIGAANRDPRRHVEPDRLDVRRRSAGALSFGHGPHVCIGAALSLMEAEAVFGQLLRKWPTLRLAGAAHWNGNPVYRGLTSLPVRSGLHETRATHPAHWQAAEIA